MRYMTGSIRHIPAGQHNLLPALTGLVDKQKGFRIGLLKENTIQITHLRALVMQVSVSKEFLEKE